MIKMKNVCKTYEGFQFDLSMEIPNGRITGLVGKNGAGKSTAIKLILGLTEAESGEITIFGKMRASVKHVRESPDRSITGRIWF